MNFIEIEGITGSGKTTLSKYLKKYLKILGYKIKYVKEPGSTKLGLDIRKILLNKHYNNLSSLTQILLFMANRSDIYEKYLKNSYYDFVLFDRYYGSTMIYQILMSNYNLQKKYNNLLNIIMQTITNKHWPIDMTILLDINPILAYTRIKKRQKVEYRSPYEANDYITFLKYNLKARRYFKKYINKSKKTKHRIILDASRSINSTMKIASKALCRSFMC